MGKLVIAVPTKRHDGLEDVVSEVFGKAKTFTIVDVEDGKVKGVRVVDNPAATYQYGAGPIVVKTLLDLKTNLVVTAELGPGASGLLEQHSIRTVLVRPNTKVADSIAEALSKPKAKPSSEGQI